MTEGKVRLFAVVLEDYIKQGPNTVQAHPCCLLGTVFSELLTELPLCFGVKGAS